MAAKKNQKQTITKEEIKKTQIAWGNGIVKIGEAYTNEGYQKAKEVATALINKHYDYQNEHVLFKPTLAAIKPFRLDFEGALSYFVGGNPNYPEDNGFALKPYINVSWENKGDRIIGNMAVSMGHYYFYITPNEFVKVEYSFAYTKDKDGQLKIVLHHSSLPYNPE